MLATASVGALAFGGLAIMGPASAGTWGGHYTCSSGKVVSASGYKGGTGPITLKAPYREFTDSSSTKNVRYNLRGTRSSGSWTVTGSGATSGYAYCG